MYELQIYIGGKIVRTKQFSDYKEALKAAAKAERQGEGATEIKFIEVTK